MATKKNWMKCGFAGLVFLSLAASPGRSETGLVIEEILVTAQKKTESLAEIPMTVNVISGDQFRRLAGFDFRDLDKMTAGIAVNGENFDVDFAVRGLGTDLNAAIDPRVTIYWDGAYSAQPRATFVSQFDLERFELLRGPQGTLYGKSSPAGALTVQSKSPTMDAISGYVQQAFSERDGSNSQVAVSVPIIKNELAVRVAAVYDENRNQDVWNSTLDKQSLADSNGARAVLAWQPGENFDLRMSYNYVEGDKDINNIVEGNGLHYEDRIAVNEFASTSHERHRHTVLEMNWSLPNGWLATSVSGYQQSLVERNLDNDNSAVAGQNQQVTSDVDKVFNQELRLQSIGDGSFWDWTAGAFYQDTTAETPVYVDNFRVQGLPAPNYLAVVTEVNGPSINEAEDWALFLHNAFHLSAIDTLTVGLRYSYIDRFNQQTFQQDSYLLIGDFRAGPVNQATVEGVPLPVQKLDFDALTGTLKLQRQVSDALMAYASYDRAWRGGSVNIGGQPLPGQWTDFDEEASDNFELGVKWQFLDGRGLLSTALYYQLYNDFQYGAQNINYVLDGGSIAQNSPVVNADGVSSRGVEMELTYLLAQNWDVTVSTSYNQTEFDTFDDAPCNDAEQPLSAPGDYATCDLKGEPAGYLPEWSTVILSEYYQSFGDRGLQWYMRGLFKVEGSRWDPDVGESHGGYHIVDLFTGVRGAEGQWDISLWAKNVLDNQARLSVSPTIPVPDYSVIGNVAVTDVALRDTGYTRIDELLAPRTIGLTGLYRF